MTTIRTNAYIPSASEFDFIRKKFPAFAAAQVSQKAKIQGASVGKTGFGNYQLRTAFGDKFKTWHAHSTGCRCTLEHPDLPDGLRVCLKLLYAPQSAVVGTCEDLTQTYTIYDNKIDCTAMVGEHGEEVSVTSTAPIITFASQKYIWLNKEDCENGTSNIMDCISLELLEKAMLIDENRQHNDYGKATKLHDQCERVAFESATDEERNLVVEVMMSSEDNYDVVSPVLTTK